MRRGRSLCGEGGTSVASGAEIFIAAGDTASRAEYASIEVNVGVVGGCTGEGQDGREDEEKEEEGVEGAHCYRVIISAMNGVYACM